MEKVYVLGGSQSDFERNWKKEGKNMVALIKEVVCDGLNEVCIGFDEIRRLNSQNRIACFVGNFLAEKYINQGHLGAFLTEIDDAFYGVPSARYEAACASSSAAIEAAQSKIKSGECDVAIVVGWELMKTVNSSMCAEYLGYASYFDIESKGVDLPFPKLFGRLADETIKKYNLDEERYMKSLAQIVAYNYDNAKRNPLAQTRKWFMNFTQANMRGTDSNPFVGNRLASSDCSQITDGAAMIVLASEKYVEEKGIKNKPVIKGCGHRTAPMLFDKKMTESSNNKFILPWTRQAIVDAYQRSGLTVEDIDLFETHDCFSSSEYMSISAFGITEPGKEYEAIENGTISFLGDRPVNPSGGLIGCGHPVGASGARMMLDLYKQVSNTAGTYQVKEAKNAMMLNFGGSATTNYVFIVGVDK